MALYDVTTPLRKCLHEHLTSRTCRGVLRSSGRVAVVNEEEARHLHCPLEPVGACFGEWIASHENPGSRSSSAAPPGEDSGHFELILLPEETIYLACVVGCLEVTSSLERQLPAGSPLLHQLLLLAAEGGDDEPVNVKTAVNEEASSCTSGESYAAAINKAVVYRHFLHQGYTVKDGVLYGVHFLLYNGTPETVHSDYGIWITGLPAKVRADALSGA
jgi:hypothetical protein